MKNLTIGETMTLGQLDSQIDGHIEKYDVQRDLVVMKDKEGSLDIDGINYIFKFEEFNSENELNTVITIKDIEEL